MKDTNQKKLLDGIVHISQQADLSEDGHRCMVSPSPELKKKINKELKKLGKSAGDIIKRRMSYRDKKPVGKDDGVIYPGNMFPLGTPANVVRSAAADRAPLTGTVRVVVILVEFSDQAIGQNNQHFEDLFFSQGTLPNGSVREYFAEVTNDLVDIQGEVVGPYQLPLTIVEYANGDSGTGLAQPNARTMAFDAAEAANPDVDFSIYDNDGDGFVDAFIVIHAGSGAELTGSVNDIWSHKWVLSGGEYDADGTKIYAYLTVPEDARIGVCCHELGHLLFGFPDLYDTDDSSEGVGNWCLMGGGSWNGGGDIPAHPCAWCKVDQGWISVINQTTNISTTIDDVKDNYSAYRLWKDGAAGSEYFLVENRQKNRYDAELPGEGLLIWHIDETVSTNSDESHYKIGLEQADGNRDLENGNNRGDAGDTFPGTSNNTTFDKNSTPNSRSYGDIDTCVAVKNISALGPVIQATLQVKCGGKNLRKDLKDFKEGRKEYKEFKEFRKEFKETKEFKKEFKETKEFKKETIKDKPEKEIYEKDFMSDKRPEKPDIDKSNVYDKGFTDNKFIDNKFTDGGFGFDFNRNVEPFIDEELRPDLQDSALSEEEDLKTIQKELRRNAVNAKRAYDTKPKET